uniref:Secreted protein n=1 Tax=Aegilops tauschii subsp. strangulata TaxID=200361 RepID=A0A453J0R0_AEGTS
MCSTVSITIVILLYRAADCSETLIYSSTTSKNLCVLIIDAMSARYLTGRREWPRPGSNLTLGLTAGNTVTGRVPMEHPNMRRRRRNMQSGPMIRW